MHYNLTDKPFFKTVLKFMILIAEMADGETVHTAQVTSVRTRFY